MNAKLATLGIACALALAACGGDAPPPAAAPSPAAKPAPSPTAPAEPATADTQATDAAGATDPAASADPSAAAAPAEAAGEAVVSNCATTIEGDDVMRYNVGSITVPSSCTEFTITLRHTGQLPVAAMGHNVVISLASDRAAIAADGIAAGVEGHYVPADDPRVIAHTELVGGGGTTSVTFPASAISGDGPYEFFCSFPGHWSVMRGTIRVG